MKTLRSSSASKPQLSWRQQVYCAAVCCLVYSALAYGQEPLELPDLGMPATIPEQGLAVMQAQMLDTSIDTLKAFPYPRESEFAASNSIRRLEYLAYRINDAGQRLDQISNRGLAINFTRDGTVDSIEYRAKANSGMSIIIDNMEPYIAPAVSALGIPERWQVTDGYREILTPVVSESHRVGYGTLQEQFQRVYLRDDIARVNRTQASRGTVYSVWSGRSKNSSASYTIIRDRHGRVTNVMQLKNGSPGGWIARKTTYLVDNISHRRHLFHTYANTQYEYSDDGEGDALVGISDSVSGKEDFREGADGADLRFFSLKVDRKLGGWHDSILTNNSIQYSSDDSGEIWGNLTVLHSDKSVPEPQTLTTSGAFRIWRPYHGQPQLVRQEVAPLGNADLLVRTLMPVESSTSPGPGLGANSGQTRPLGHKSRTMEMRVLDNGEVRDLTLLEGTLCRFNIYRDDSGSVSNIERVVALTTAPLLLDTWTDDGTRKLVNTEVSMLHYGVEIVYDQHGQATDIYMSFDIHGRRGQREVLSLDQVVRWDSPE